MSDWQPIETVPRDGRWFFVGGPNVVVPAPAHFKPDGQMVIHLTESVHGSNADVSRFNRWQPIPAPPKETSDGQG